MSEDVFLIICCVLFGVPLIIGLIFFSVFMSQHNKEMEESVKVIEEIKKRREERELIK